MELVQPHIYQQKSPLIQLLSQYSTRDLPIDYSTQNLNLPQLEEEYDQSLSSLSGKNAPVPFPEGERETTHNILFTPSQLEL